MDESEPKIDVDTLIRRLTSLYSSWKNNRNQFWASSTVFFVSTPTSSPDVRLLNKSLAFCTWLLGYELPGILMVFSDRKIHFLCGQDDASLIYAARNSVKEALEIDFVMHVKAENQDGSTKMEKLLHAVGSKRILGYMASEASMVEKWMIKVKASCIKLVDVTNGVAELMFVRDSPGLLSQKIAASITASAMEEIVVPMLHKIMKKGKKVEHSWLMRETIKAMLDPSLLTENLNPEVLQICYPPVIQSGGKFDLGPKASTNDDYLDYDDSGCIIISTVGLSYENYCANVARTFLINSTASQNENYRVLLRAHEAAIRALKDGGKAKEVYEAAYKVVEEEAPMLTSHLTKSAGTGIGIQFRDMELILNEKNERIIKAGMVFNLSLGFGDLQSKSKKAKSQKYALFVADTVMVTQKDCKVLTGSSSKAILDVNYSISVNKALGSQKKHGLDGGVTQKIHAFAGGINFKYKMLTASDSEDEEVGETWEDPFEADVEEVAAGEELVESEEDLGETWEDLVRSEKLEREEMKRRKIKELGKSRAGSLSRDSKRPRLS